MESSVAMEHETAGAPATPDALIELIRSLAAELHPGRTAIPATLDHRLEQDYGFDSLGRVELFLRIEKRFGVDASRSGHGGRGDAARPAARDRGGRPGSPRARPPRSERASGLAVESETPDEAVTLPEVLAWHVRRHPDRPHIVLQDEDGGERTVTYAELDQAARAVGGGPHRARPRAGPGGGDHAADERRVLLQLLRHPARRAASRSRSIRPRAPRRSRTTCGVTRASSPTRRTVDRSSPCRRPSRSRCCCKPRVDDAARGGDAGGADAARGGGDGAPRAGRRTSRCSSTPPAAPAIPRASFSPTPTCSPTSARWAERCG